jgi:TusA-related sulfurtransferase
MPVSTVFSLLFQSGSSRPENSATVPPTPHQPQLSVNEKGDKNNLIRPIVQKFGEHFKVESENGVVVYWIEKRIFRPTKRYEVLKVGDLIDLKLTDPAAGNEVLECKVGNSGWNCLFG